MRIDVDEAARWIVVHRGALAIIANLGETPATVPVTGEVVTAWAPPTLGAEATTVDGQSFAILRTARHR